VAKPPKVQGWQQGCLWVSADYEVAKWGESGQYNFEVKDHVDLGGLYGLDFEAAIALLQRHFNCFNIVS
jgi:hypothetical protein